MQFNKYAGKDLQRSTVIIVSIKWYTFTTQTYVYFPLIENGNSVTNLANTKHLYNIYTILDQRRRRWADVV